MPRKCFACGLSSNVKGRDLCSYCKEFLPTLEDSPHMAPYLYEQPFVRIIHQLKFGGKIEYARTIGNLMIEYLQNKSVHKELPKILIPVPLHPERQKKRGYNQCEEIANIVAAQLDMIVDTQSCKRVKNTSAQATLERELRVDNMQGAFVCEGLQAEHVAILDDVVTTGATVGALSEVLYQTGVQIVEVWSLCRGSD